MSRNSILLALIAVVAVLFVGYGSAQSDQPTRDCIRNQTWSLCGKLCEPTCENPNPNTLLCPTIVCSVQLGIGACRCNNGYLRKDNGRCVLPRDC